jgi:hypothetical protein
MVNEVSTALFLDVLSKWVQAAERRDAADAAFQAQQLRVAGSLLAMHPEFAMHDGGMQPTQAMGAMLHFLEAVGHAHLRRQLGN